jgi:hypothetical protein
MSFEAMDGVRHVYKLKDDLESFIYIVLYCAVRWLPVTSEHSLDVWLAGFFTGGSMPLSGGSLLKRLNAVAREFTKDLQSKTSTRILEWLREAMDLHYKNMVPNPLWDDGKALGAMWRRKLEGDIPDNDRRREALGENRSTLLRATFTAGPPIRLRKNEQRSADPVTSAKRPHASYDGDTEDSHSKRLKSNGKGDERQAQSSATPVAGCGGISK